jgi:predicted phage terminase large subunit-like protein
MKAADRKALEAYKKKLEFARAAGVASAFEPAEAKAARIERCKKDYSFFLSYYFPQYATSECSDFHAEWANKVAKNKLFKGFCEWGRGLAKSVSNDIALPFWLWLRGEEVYFVLIGNSHNRAKQLLDDLMAEFEANPRIINDFGEQKQEGTWESGFFITKGGFIGQALGMGQSVRGLRVKHLRPTHIVCDDMETKEVINNPARQNKIVRWIEQDLLPTMDGPVRRFALAQNRASIRMIQTILQDKHPKWFVHNIKAFDPVTYKPRWKEKYDDDYYYELAEGDEGIGLLACLAEYNGEPHIEGEIFKDDQIQWIKLPRMDHFKHIVAHWDVAYAGTQTSDFNAIRIWGLQGRNFYYIDSFVKQTKMRAALEYMADVQISLENTNVIIHWQFEAQFWNDEVERTIQEVEDEYDIELRLRKVQVKGNKYDRILTLQPYYQNGRIYYNEQKKAHNDTAVGIAQLKGIEPGYKTHDDAPDADEQCIQELSKYVTRDARKGSNEIRMGKYEKRRLH